MHNGDVLIHIDDTLDDQALNRLLRETGENPGVIGACINERARHLMVVDFDAEATKPSAILHSMRQRGIGAELIGLRTQRNTINPKRAASAALLSKRAFAPHHSKAPRSSPILPPLSRLRRCTGGP